MTVCTDQRSDGQTSSSDGPGAFELVRAVVHGGGEIWVGSEGDSMYPTVMPGSDILIGPLPKRLRRGDIVVADNGRRLVMHRVVHISPVGVLTMGDACLMLDRAWSPGELIAMAWALRRGRVIVALAPTLRFGPLALLRYACLRGRLAAARVWRAIRVRSSHQEYVAP